MPSKRAPVTSRLTDVRSNKCRLTCAHCGCNVDIHTHSWYARASLPRNRFLFHINCNMIVSNKCSSHFLLQQSLFSWLLHQHHLSTNKSGHFQTSWLLFARLYNYSLPTRMCFAQTQNTTIWIRSRHLAISQHILVDSTAATLSASTFNNLEIGTITTLASFCWMFLLASCMG